MFILNTISELTGKCKLQKNRTRMDSIGEIKTHITESNKAIYNPYENTITPKMPYSISYLWNRNLDNDNKNNKQASMSTMSYGTSNFELRTK